MMQEIQDKQKEVEEYKYKIREMSTQIKVTFETLKEHIPTFREMGMLEEEDLEYINNLTLESIDSVSFDEQIAFLDRIDSIKTKLDEATELLNDRIQEVEGRL